MVINICVQFNDGFLPDIILNPRLLPLGNPVKYHVVALYFLQSICNNSSILLLPPCLMMYYILYLQPLIQPKRCDISPPLSGGCSEGLGAF